MSLGTLTISNVNAQYSHGIESIMNVSVEGLEGVRDQPNNMLQGGENINWQDTFTFEVDSLDRNLTVSITKRVSMMSFNGLCEITMPLGEVCKNDEYSIPVTEINQACRNAPAKVTIGFKSTWNPAG